MFTTESQRTRRNNYFFVCRETAANENHHASGSWNKNRHFPKGLGLFLFALLSEKE